MNRPAVLLPIACAILAPGALRADAIVRSNAMNASTIAEFFIEEGEVRVELEIGAPDVAAFGNLYPDDAYAKLGLAPRPHEERLREFFERDLVIAGADGQPLPGRLLEIGPRLRPKRDDITGEPLPPTDDDETAIFARLSYALEGRPDTLALRGVRSTQPVSIGFVAYHGGVAVNDFRYLVPAQTLTLDWEDPWYSRFEGRSLRRQYFAPMSGFLYVEPFEVRKEIVLRPKDLQRFVDLGLAGRDAIPVAMWEEVLRGSAEFLRGRQRVEIDGVALEPELARSNFLERTLRTSRVIDPPRELDLNAAMIGVIFVYPIEALPQRVTMDWDLWDERVQQVPASSVDEAGPLPTLLDPEDPELVWQNFLVSPTVPTLAVIERPPSALTRSLGGLRWVLAGVALLLLLRAIATRDPWSRSARGAFVAGSAAFLVFVAARGAGLPDERARGIVSGLLHNVYRAFDSRGEERIYDALAASASGELLERIYLETRRGLELASQGGARVRVKDVELAELEAAAAEGGAFDARATWIVGGSVGHWGHVHQRRNRYRAELRVAPVNGVWKLVDLEVLEEERL